MSAMKTEPYQTLRDLLDTARVHYGVMLHEPIYTSEQAAAIRRMDIGQGAKSLLFAAKTGYILVVVPGDKRVDSKRLKQRLNVKEIRFATPEAVEAQMDARLVPAIRLESLRDY